MNDIDNYQGDKSFQTPSFVKEVAKYFMCFLETDFKKRRIPKRNTIQKVLNGLKVAIDLDKYDSLKKVLLSSLNKGFVKEDFSIKKGAYTTSIPASLLELISRKIDKLSEEDLQGVFAEIKTHIEETSLLHKKEHDKFLEESIEGSKNIFAKKLVLPFLDDLDKPLENLELADENSKFQLEVDIVDSLFSSFEISFSEMLQTYSQHEESYDIKVELKKIILLPELKVSLTSFFENFAVGDAYTDLYQLFRNNKLIDKTELYLYFYEIALGDEKFPVIYLPLSIEKEDHCFNIKFDNRIFVNTKAIDFVVQEYNPQVNKQATLAGEFERIIYLHDQENFHLQIESIIKKLEDFFELNRNIDVTNSQLQKGLNLVVSLSNKCYFYLFDKSDESLINDYEEILNDNGLLLEKFNELLTSFIEIDPTSVIQDVDDEWDDKEIPNKLIFESPIPLNDEQKHVLMALEKPNCKFLVLEGPPGTGKSHTITAIICKALLEEKSVLVLSDKKEALDVVEDKITETLNKIRHEDDFQNPILRLGKSGNKFYKIVQGQTIQKIKEHYRAYKNNKDEYDSARTQTSQDLKKSIQENIEYFESISINDIDYYFKNSDKYVDFDWITNENLSDLKPALLKVKSIIENIRRFGNLSIRADWLSDDYHKLLQQFRLSMLNLIEIKSQTVSSSHLTKIEEMSSEEREQLKTNTSRLLELVGGISELINGFDQLVIEPFDNNVTFSELKENLERFIKLRDIFIESKKLVSKNLNIDGLLNNFQVPEEIEVDSAIEVLKKYTADLTTLKKPLIGYIFQKDKVLDSTRNFKKAFHYFNLNKPEKELRNINSVLDFFEILQQKTNNENLSDKEFRVLLKLLTDFPKEEQHFSSELISDVNEFLKIVEEITSHENLSLNQIDDLINTIDLVEAIETLIKSSSLVKPFDSLDVDLSKKHLQDEDLKKDIDVIEMFCKQFEDALSIKDDLNYLDVFSDSFPSISRNISLIKNDYIYKITCKLTDIAEEDLLGYIKLKEIERKLDDQFNYEENSSYSENVSTLEDLVTAQMTYFLDKRIIDYSENHANEVNTLKNIIRKKQKFPKELFQNLKKAFPCILAGVRDYAEYIPLEKDLFDLIIIDEASQVSIAQSLPALIRGKQVVVLGDDKQFSNVKANNASKVTNQELKNRVHEAFVSEKMSGEDNLGWLTKVQENFDIKNSILKFMRFVRNYECQLKKHFRCYPEIISYSDKFFYDGTLQCMKVRGVPVENVIKFDVIEHDGKIDASKNTNDLEAKFIIKKLKDFKEKDVVQSLGIITPHREQVTLLFDLINELPEREWLFGKCKLKIMTFDTCQGEERDYIFYSMVATKEKDRLNWIFPVDLAKISDEIDGTVKSQRLNVGFSRAKDCIHFVLSKNIEEFKGEIKNALLHYKNELDVSVKNKRGETDKNSPMEDKIRHYFYETPFYKDNKDSIELIPQFPLGEYLRQLDINYVHPLYKVDFLLLYGSDKVVIEYDGFKEHFGNQDSDDDINISNYKYYMNADDIYRQKVLEGYGYKFLRINKFNIGVNPINSLDQKLRDIVKKKSKIRLS